MLQYSHLGKHFSAKLAYGKTNFIKPNLSFLQLTAKLYYDHSPFHHETSEMLPFQSLPGE
jgi:hypothetical protein